MNMIDFGFFLYFLKMVWRFVHFCKLEILLVPQLIVQDFLHAGDTAIKVTFVLSLVVWAIAVVKTIINRIKGV